MGEFAKGLEKRVRPVPKSAGERLDVLEKRLAEMTRGLNAVFGQVGDRLEATRKDLENLAVAVEALTDLAGRGRVKDKVLENYEARCAETRSEMETALEAAVKDGKAERVERVDAGCVVVGSETTPDGRSVGCGRIEVPFDNLVEPVKAALLGAVVGTEIKTPTGNTFKVLDVYKTVATPPGEEAGTTEATG